MNLYDVLNLSISEKVIILKELLKQENVIVTGAYGAEGVVENITISNGVIEINTDIFTG